MQVTSTGSPSGYGVHGTVVLSDGSNAGELVDQDANDCIWLDEVDGRHIFEQMTSVPRASSRWSGLRRRQAAGR